MKKLSFIALALLALVACTNDDNKTDNGENQESGVNWWDRSQLAPKGVKSISSEDEYSSNQANYDEQGRLVSTFETWGQNALVTNTIKYDSEGRVASTTQTTQEQQRSTTTVTSYEYGNPGKYVPSIGNMAHLNETGLAHAISKIVTVTDGDTSSVCSMQFTSSTEMLIINQYGRWSDTATVKYNGAYPTEYYDGGWFYTGPITYQSNGMFREYNDGFRAPGEQAANARTYTYRTDYDKSMLLAQYQDVTPQDRTVSNYEYDTNGNLIKETRHHYGTSSEYDYQETTTYTYIFDSHGNWTSRTTTFTQEGAEPNSYTKTRTISYY